ncbi:MAG TPA: hypothetical protein VHM28_09790 [Anaerolineales bacterium]|jgi:hypothetical protein|nr:hypothetical protein [Anaerolineales bacterium]
MATTKDKPNGPISAALLAGGIGSAVFGLVTLAYELNDTSAFAGSLSWYKPTGGLSGKSSLGILAFFVSWAILHYLWKDKETDFNRITMLAYVLLAIGLVGTFPPVWHLLAGG